MFNSSRRKIILSIMGSLILLFAVTLSVIMFASQHEIQQENMAMLKRHVELYNLKEGSEGREEPSPSPEPDNSDMHGPEPWGRPPLDRRPDYQLSTFYSVAFGKNETVLEVNNGDKKLYSKEKLVNLAKKILAVGRKSGRSGSLTYFVSRRPNYTLVAFIDNTVSESGLGTLLRNFLIIGGISIFLMFFISLYLSKRIIRPLEENDRRQKQFISDASHELKTPVAVIETNAELLSRELGENEWLSNILYENERMGELVKQLLELSKAENAGLVMEEIDFSRIVTEETLVFDTLAFERGKLIKSEIEEKVLVMGNKTQLMQLVSILLDNAMRHLTGNEIEICLKSKGHTAVMSVINEGKEIPLEKQAHLFDRFYQIDEARNSEGQHYGLGLSIAKAVVERHGGNISVSCQGGKVRFAVSLPIKK